MQRPLLHRRNLHLLEADLERCTIEEDAAVGSGRAPDGGEPCDLFVVILSDLKAIEGGSPEASERSRSAAVDDELSQPGHAAILAAGTTELNRTHRIPPG